MANNGLLCELDAINCKRKVVLMKTGLLIICLTLLPLTAKDNAELKELTVGPARSGLQFVKVHVAARNIQEGAGTVYFKGSVDINFGSYMLLADKAEYDQQSGEIRAHGNVLMKPVPPDPRGMRQFGIK
jgi:lipopolysaccharide assembly outer membrane protein LptD (OstA)